MKETCFDYLDCDKYGVFSSDERKWIAKINKLKEQFPDCVVIKRTPEENDGMLIAHLPKEWMKITPPRKVNITEERRAVLIERMNLVRSQKDLADELEDDDEDV